MILLVLRRSAYHSAWPVEAADGCRSLIGSSTEAHSGAVVIAHMTETPASERKKG
jgi:hypothetical protein